MKTKETAQKKRGRPSKYTEELADLICALLARGQSLNSICSLDEMPTETAVRGWAIDNVEGFSSKYTRAREMQADFFAEEIISLSDDDSKDLSGELQIPNSAAVQRSKLRVDARKWFASKVAPKKYGDKIAAVGPDGEGPIEVIVRKIGSSKSV